MLSPVETEAVIGEVEVRALFKVSRLGTIAGCMVTSGVVRRGSSVRIFRDGARIHETTVAQLKRFKDDAREVTEGFECGILLEGFNDLREGDIFEVYETREVERTSLDERPRRRSAAGLSAGRADSCSAGLRRDPRVELHFPEAGSLKGKRKLRASAKAQLQNRFGASVAEVDHHELWQRCALDGGVRRPRGARGRELAGRRRAVARGSGWVLVARTALVAPERLSGSIYESTGRTRLEAGGRAEHGA